MPVRDPKRSPADMVKGMAGIARIWQNIKYIKVRLKHYESRAKIKQKAYVMISNPSNATSIARKYITL